MQKFYLGKFIYLPLKQMIYRLKFLSFAEYDIFCLIMALKIEGENEGIIFSNINKVVLKI